jgi:hypothetical protein
VTPDRSTKGKQKAKQRTTGVINHMSRGLQTLKLQIPHENKQRKNFTKIK